MKEEWGGGVMGVIKIIMMALFNKINDNIW